MRRRLLLRTAPPDQLDLSRFIDWTPYAPGTRYFSVAGVGKHGGEVGEGVGILALRHCGGYEVVLRFKGGKLGSFAPHSLFPVTREEQHHNPGVARLEPRLLELPL